jgi:shikimate 5-dehydrogenase
MGVSSPLPGGHTSPLARLWVRGCGGSAALLAPALVEKACRDAVVAERREKVSAGAQLGG